MFLEKSYPPPPPPLLGPPWLGGGTGQYEMVYEAQNVTHIFKLHFF